MRGYIVGVMGSRAELWTELAAPLGHWLARRGHHLLTGAGQGVMLEVSKAYHEIPDRKGMTIGIVPTDPDEEVGFKSKPGYPNRYIDIPIVAPLPVFRGDDPLQVNRNHINILTSDIVVALPGGIGTRNEVDLALRFRRPVILFGPSSAFAEFPRDVPRATELAAVREFVEHETARLAASRERERLDAPLTTEADRA